MRIGTIINNHWASEENPTKYFIYTGIKGKSATGITINNGKLEKTEYYKRDLDDKTNFEPVGYCDAFEIMKRDLKKVREETK